MPGDCCRIQKVRNMSINMKFIQCPEFVFLVLATLLYVFKIRHSTNSGSYIMIPVALAIYGVGELIRRKFGFISLFK